MFCAFVNHGYTTNRGLQVARSNKTSVISAVFVLDFWLCSVYNIKCRLARFNASLVEATRYTATVFHLYVILSTASTLCQFNSKH